MNVRFYYNMSDRNTVSKQITQVGKVVACKIKEGTNILNPTIIIAKQHMPNIVNINYFYIDTFKRYYFLDASTLVTLGGIVEVSGAVDVLQSNITAINNTVAQVLKNEYQYDKMIVDPDVCIKQGRKLAYLTIGTLPSTMYNYLTVTGGNK